MMEEKKEVKKKNKIIKYLLALLGVILIGVGSFLLLNKSEESKDEKEETISLKDDYYSAINNPLKDSVFSTAQQAVYKNLAKIGTEIENDPNFTDTDYLTFFELYEDYTSRDEDGLKVLQPYFDEIDNATTLDEFSDALLNVNYDLGVMTFLNWGLSPDFYDNTKTVIAFQPMVLESVGAYSFDPDTPSGLEYFTNEKYNTYKTIFENARISYLKEYGYDEEKATDISNQITEFAKTIQEKSLTIDELYGNREGNFKKKTYSELKTIFKNLPIDKLLKKYNLKNTSNFAIYDEGHLKALDEFYKEENLPLMKEILKLVILEDVASLYSTTNYAQIFADVYAGLSGEKVGAEEILSYQEFIELKPKMMGQYLERKYDENYFTEIEKQEIIELINKVKDYYKEVINNSEWLEDSTKQEALKKLEAMNVNVGYVEREDDDTQIGLLDKEHGGSLLSDIIMMRKYSSSKYSEKVNQKMELVLDQFGANAYYNFYNNSINFPSAFREIYRGIEGKYEMYGYVGMIVAHEISHAFDNTGSKYDENGNLKEWWTEEDLKKYEELQQKIIDYYSKYEVFGMKVNGETTVGENISDLAAVKTMINIMENENATNDDFKKFFESYAKLWVEKTNKKLAELKILSDNHSPNSVRVNAVLSSMDKFYEVYDIKESDKMYVAKEDRVGLW